MNELLDGWAVMERAIELSRRGEAFALATVVWRTAPSSGRDGARAIVTAGGEVYGWVGGACAEPVLIREAREVIRSGRSRLLWLGRPAELEEVHVPDGVVAVPLACQSEGALQLFIEPAHTAPRLVIVGRSPMVVTLTRLAEALDWDVHAVDGPDLAGDTVTPSSVVVVATQGHDDEGVLERVLAAGPQFVGLVTSRRRGEAVIGYLADRGIDRERLDEVRFPVGLDLGHTSHREIAVAVLAELVQLRAAGALSGGREPATIAEVEQVTDPVCGMTVDVGPSTPSFEHNGRTYHFCCPGCRQAFSKGPAGYLGQEAR
ncbi:XdhC family protein [Nitriliruptor alkaliphilus]|uniref:XdhC family protein n=1 Tax=Nitriliruptor alkaliphilus TaxID=427918 RepID=UPI0006981D18|nr:XdhC family protein [Nitriliruptor alkaliphilus]